MVMEIPNQPQQIIQDTNKDKTEFVISKFIEPKEHMKATIEEKIQADKQQMIKEGIHPYYWAGFIISGE